MNPELEIRVLSYGTQKGCSNVSPEDVSCSWLHKVLQWDHSPHSTPTPEMLLPYTVLGCYLKGPSPMPLQPNDSDCEDEFPLVGYCALAEVKLGALGSESEAYIQSVCIQKELRRRGIGLAFLREVLQWAQREWHASRFRLHVMKPCPSAQAQSDEAKSHQNLAALRLYQSLGFSIRKFLPKYYEGAHDGAELVYSVRTQKSKRPRDPPSM